jgi:hypothetical protein
MVQQRQKQRYDSHRKEKSYNVGDFVWVYRPLRKKGRRSAKLLHNYHGPFQVTQKLKSPTNALKLVIGRNKKLVYSVHYVTSKRFILDFQYLNLP